MATLEDVRELCLSLPETSERLSHGTPTFFVGKKLFAHIRDDMATLSVKMAFDERDVMMAAEPRTFFITPHYLKYEMVVIHVDAIDRERLDEELRKSWALAATKKIRALLPA